MNKQIFSHKSKQIVFALIAIATLGIASSPTKADDAVIQESVQESVITGNDNVSVQNSNQRNRQVTESRTYRGDGDHYQEQSNTGIVQRSDQFCDQLGEYNTCVQDAQQSNSNYTRRLRQSRH